MGADQQIFRSNRVARARAQRRLPVSALQRGYTLFELMTVVAVVGIIAAFALPAFNTMIISNRLSTTTNLLIGSIRQAQLEGIRHNGGAQFCSNSTASNGTDPLGSSCGTSLGMVYYTQPISGGASQYQKTQNNISPPSNVFVGDGTSGTTAVTALRFGADGLASTPANLNTPYTGLVADVYSTSFSRNNHRCIYMATGNQLSTCIVTGGLGACNAAEPNSCQQQFQQK